MNSLKYFQGNKGSIAWLHVAVLVFASIAPVLMSVTRVEAAQLGDRFIEMSSASTSETNATYTVSFVTSTTANLDGMVVDFCSGSDSPIIGDACTDPTGMDVDTGTAVPGASQSGVTDWSIDATNSTDGLLVLDRTAASVPSSTTVSFDITGVTNPTTTGTFYARILTFDNGGQDSYVSATPGTHVDDGGIALSTANQIQITARVQEQLTFCVGNTDANSAQNCTDISGTAIDLGVLDPTSVNIASDTVSQNTDNEGSAYARVSTNAQKGAVVQYTAGDLTDGSNVIAAVGATEATVDAGDEEWGLTIRSIDTADGSTTNLVRTANYDADVGYAFTPDTLTTLADSGGGAGAVNRVLDNEQLVIDFAASVSPVTPTGLYTTSVSFIATGTF